ncbi:HAD family hydrolase [Ochrobactrum vermis]|uniref:phosphoserine phosphatase n=1 Tax=Ochrobactrum vermis TaxID=1827297 RepID=A0ABU8P957_9HYPH|nr:HAD family hydrolase [Ochrobactrum vermis]PQZ29326.1 haloacid dehalogenase [Ochrobactrum vermis]
MIRAQIALKPIHTVFLTLTVLVICLCQPVLAQDPLPSWRDGATKTSIIEFVTSVAIEGNKNYVQPDDRIAVFDNDGTLWSEQPFYIQLGFALDRVKTLAEKNPDWKEKEPFKSVLNNDFQGVAASGEKGLIELVMATHAGMTTDEFNRLVTKWFATARHPKTDRLYTEMTYLPMHELLEYLRENGFKTFIVSGGGVEFMRPVTQALYGIPPEQVVGSSIETKYEVIDEVPTLTRLPKIDFIDDGAGKPVGINKFIGRRPIFVAGNSDGDYEMLRWATAKSPSFGMIVHHTDAEREFAYDRKSAFGKLDKALDEAQQHRWTVVDMKDDWAEVFSPKK